MKPFKKYNPIQIRWKEPLGIKECPYAYRWVFNFYFFAFRVHHFIRSEPIKHQHDHAWDFITFIMKGGYVDVSSNRIDKLRAGSIRYRKAEHIHNVVLPRGKDCWTLLLTFRPRRKWGFWVNGKLKRPLKYFYKYGHFPCED